MKISDFLGFSLIDFPKTPAFVIFTQGCNFRCPYCHNPSLIPLLSGETHLDPVKVMGEIKRRTKLIKGVVITGGEPTIQKGLLEFLQELKGTANLKIKLDTNGSNPTTVEKLLERNLLDYIALDFKTSEHKYHLAIGHTKERAQIHFKNLLKTLELLEKSKVPYEVRTTVVPQLVNEEDLKIIRGIIGPKTTFVLQRFRNEVTFDSNYQKLKPYEEEQLLELAQSVNAILH